MADVAGRDGNAVPSALAVSSVDGTSTVKLYADPTTHRLLVDLSGGVYPSELGMEIPSGTVNGVNVTFTVQNVPIFVDTSGQVNVSQTQDGTNYGFTVTGSSAPYTLTFVNAPTQTPHSFYNYSSAGASLASLFQTDIFTATANQTAFTATQIVVRTQYISQNGQILTPTTDYTVSGNTATLTSGAVAGDKIVWEYIT